MGALIVSGLVAIAAANALWWWYRDRVRQAEVRRMRRQLAHARSRRNHWLAQASVARAKEREATRRADSLAERNEMLTDLMGGEGA